MIRSQTANIVIDGVPMECQSFELDLDETRAPFALASFTVKYSAANAAALDPRADVRVTGFLEQRFTGADPVSAISEDFPAYSRTNRIANPSFEVSTTGWTVGGSGATLVRTTGTPWVGAAFGRLTSGLASAAFSANSATVSCTAGDLFALSFYVRGTVGRQVQLRATFNGGGGAPLSDVFIVGSTTAWQRITMVGVIPPGVTTIRPDIRVTAVGVLSGDVLDIDGGLLEYGTNVIGPYIEGTVNYGYVSTMTAAWAGLTLAQVSALYAHPWQAGSVPAPQRRPFDLSLRARTIDYVAGTITVRAASDEALLMAYAMTKLMIPEGLWARPFQMSGFTPDDIVRSVLRLAAPGAILTTDPGFIPPFPDQEARTWKPGVTAWDFLSPITASTGYRLWCDETRRWWLTVPGTATVAGTVALADDVSIVTATDTVDLDSTLWADAVVVTYSYTDQDTGLQTVRWDIAAPDSPTRVASIDHSTAYPGTGEAAARLVKLLGQGREEVVSAVSEFTAYPAQDLTIALPDIDLAGYVTGVVWRIPDDRMDVRARELTEV